MEPIKTALVYKEDNTTQKVPLTMKITDLIQDNQDIVKIVMEGVNMTSVLHKRPNGTYRWDCE